MNNPLNIAIWGLGKHALNRILPAVTDCEYLNLYGAYTRNGSVLNKTCASYQCKAFSSEEELLNNGDIDVVYLSTPIGLHYSQGKSVLTADKHLWCEKPLVNDYQQALELVELAKSKSLSMFEAFMYLYHPQYQYIRDYVADNINELKLIESRFTIPVLETPGFRHNPDLGGSALYDVGCYPLSLVQELLGEQDADIKYCDLETNREFGIDMSGNVLLEYENGIQARLDWGMGLAYENSISVLGADGKLFADKIFSKPDDYEASVIIYDQYGTQSDKIASSCNQFISMFDVFSEKLINQLPIEDEYNKILHRARLLDKINQYTNS